MFTSTKYVSYHFVRRFMHDLTENISNQKHDLSAMLATFTYTWLQCNVRVKLLKIICKSKSDSKDLKKGGGGVAYYEKRLGLIVVVQRFWTLCLFIYVCSMYICGKIFYRQGLLKPSIKIQDTRG